MPASILLVEKFDAVVIDVLMTEMGAVAAVTKLLGSGEPAQIT
jgi:hypothetical protein